ncbi:hypothetical protein BU23DRAFT_403812, partial [Bimuria novae-zelandiae CBS 107.79]
NLKQQVHSLQQQLFSTVEKVNAISDEQLTNAFRLLGASIKSLSRTINFPNRINVLDIEAIGGSVLVAPVNKELWLARGRKKSLIEAFIWSVLLQHVFCNPFAVLGPDCVQLALWWSSLFGNEGGVAANPLAERWRYTTLEQMMRVKDTITQGVVIGSEDPAQLSIMKARQAVHNSIYHSLFQISPASDFGMIDAIIDKAFALALDMAIQRCRVQTFRGQIGEVYNQYVSLHLKSSLENEDLPEGCVAFVIKPGLEKWGDGQGKHLDQKLVLVPSEVFI